MARPLIPTFVWSILSVVVVLLVWHYISSNVVDPMFLPPPWAVVKGSGEMIEQGTLFPSIGISMMRILSGWLLGSAIAIPLGLAVGTSQVVRSIIDPYIHFLRFVPAISLVTLFILWFGIGEASKIMLIAYATGFIVTVNTASGVSTVSEEKINAARILGASAWQTFFLVRVPATFPAIYVGMRLALASSFLVIAAAEMLAADSGLGYIIWTSRIYFQVDWMFVAIFALGFLGLITDRLWRYLGRTLMQRYLRDVTKY